MLLTVFKNVFLKERRKFPSGSSTSWSDDEWYLHQEKRKFIPNNGYSMIHPGKTSWNHHRREYWFTEHFTRNRVYAIFEKCNPDF